MKIKGIALALVLSVAGLTAIADQIQYLGQANQAFAARLSAINSAKESINLVTYVFEPCDSSTKIVIDALIKKARQGVEVRMVVDSRLLNKDYKEELAAKLKHEGIDLRLYNATDLPFADYSLLQNGRSHTKLLIVDGESFIIGGRNFSDEYFALSKTMNYVDRDLYIKGSSAERADEFFEELWDSKMVSQVAPTDSYKDLDAECLRKTAFDKKVATYFQSQGPGLLGELPIRSCSKIKLAVDSPDFMDSPDSGGEYMDEARLLKKRATSLFMNFISRAEKSLDIENWAYLPPHQESDIFQKLRDKNVKIQVLTNLKARVENFTETSVDYLIAQAAENDTDGAQIVMQLPEKSLNENAYELTPQGSHWVIHAKTATRDGRDVLVGSYNLDPRSFHTNLESLVTIENCSELAADMKVHQQLLRTHFIKDQSCESCERPENPGLFQKIIGIIGREFL